MLVLSIVDDVYLIFYNDSGAVAVVCTHRVIRGFQVFLALLKASVFFEDIDCAVKTLRRLLHQVLVFKRCLLSGHF